MILTQTRATTAAECVCSPLQRFLLKIPESLWELPGAEIKAENLVLVDETRTLSQKVSYYAMFTSNTWYTIQGSPHHVMDPPFEQTGSTSAPLPSAS